VTVTDGGISSPNFPHATGRTKVQTDQTDGQTDIHKKINSLAEIIMQNLSRAIRDKLKQACYLCHSRVMNRSTTAIFADRVNGMPGGINPEQQTAHKKYNYTMQ